MGFSKMSASTGVIAFNGYALALFTNAKGTFDLRKIAPLRKSWPRNP
jgi:hypothetical protein